jgi:hypothetical protein
VVPLGGESDDACDSQLAFQSSTVLVYLRVYAPGRVPRYSAIFFRRYRAAPFTKDYRALVPLAAIAKRQTAGRVPGQRPAIFSWTFLGPPGTYKWMLGKLSCGL